MKESSESEEPTESERRSGLTGRLGGLTLLGSLGLVVLLAWVCDRTARPMLERRAGESLETLARQVGVAFESELTATLLDAEALALRTPLWDSGRVLEQRDALDEFQTRRELAWAGFADEAGEIRAAPDAILEGFSAARAPWFLDNLQRPYVGWPELVPELDEALVPGLRYITVGVPVRDDLDRPIGVIGARQVWSYSPRKSVLPESAVDDGIVATFYAMPEGTWLLQSAGPDTSDLSVPAGADRARGYLHETLGGTSFLTGFARSEGRGSWLVVVRQPLEQVMAPLRQVRRHILLWGLPLALLLSWRVGAGLRRHEKDLSRLIHSADRIASGDPLADIPLLAERSPTGRLSRSLRRLVEKLRG